LQKAEAQRKSLEIAESSFLKRAKSKDEKKAYSA
jgi:hypothetical protein